MADSIAKPFIKWAGGKTQLIKDIERVLPKNIYTNSFTYIEPFVGSGAVLFWMLNNFPNLKKTVINDKNEDLINTYKTIASNPNELISILQILQNEYHALEGKDEAKKEYYYSKRELYNKRKEGNIEQAALFIFLNRTCFNGFYEVNKNNEFNVAIGRYSLPKICDRDNILAVNKVLQKVEILCGDFEDTLKHTNEYTVFYLDPPYKPLSKTSHFTTYTRDGFSDADQIRLRDFCIKLDRLGHTWILSNSDVKHYSCSNFFDELYSGFNIQRVYAKRYISGNPDRRGTITELLITNLKPYQVKDTSKQLELPLL